MKTKTNLCLLIIAFTALILYKCKKDESNPSIIEPPGNTVFDFESGFETWQSENDDMIATHNTNKAFVVHGSGSIKGSCELQGNDPENARAVFRYDPDPSINLTGLTLQFYMYIPGSLANLNLKYGTRLWILNTGASKWNRMEGPEISKSGWNRFAFTPSDFEVDSVEVVAIQIYKNDSIEEDWSGDIYYDYFSW
jgi:hypothetical protein